MKKRNSMVFLFLCIGLLFCIGCKKTDVSNAPYKIYYLNAEQTGLVEEAYTGETEDPQQSVEEMLECLQSGTDLIEEQSVIPEGVELLKYSVKDKRVFLDFNTAYYKMDVVQEVLCRAAIVRTLTQLESVELVAFYVNGETLKDSDGNTYGFFQASDFVQNTGSSIHSYEEAELKLYFADASGKKLIVEEQRVQYNSNSSLEKVIIEQLIQGPKSSELLRTIPKDTNILGTSIKEGICYVNFDERLLEILPGINPQVTIYSIVNSILEIGTVTKVQISVNGDSNIVFQESVKLGEPLGRNLDLVKEE